MKAKPICFWLLMHLTLFALALDRASAGSSRLAKMAMMAITTSSSMSVNPLRLVVFMTWRIEVGGSTVTINLCVGSNNGI